LPGKIARTTIYADCVRQEILLALAKIGCPAAFIGGPKWSCRILLMERVSNAE
jgi:hypothetical protein